MLIVLVIKYISFKSNVFNILGTTITTEVYVHNEPLGQPTNSYKKSLVPVDPTYDTEVMKQRTKLHCSVACTIKGSCFLFMFDSATKDCELRLQAN